MVDKAVSMAFGHFDKDGSGFIERSELISVLEVGASPGEWGPHPAGVSRCGLRVESEARGRLRRLLIWQARPLPLRVWWSAVLLAVHGRRGAPAISAWQPGRTCPQPFPSLAVGLHDAAAAGHAAWRGG
jgi:hypothetical protein